MADVRVVKFDIDSPTDVAVRSLQRRLDASSGGDAVRRGLAIADAVTQMQEEGRDLLVRNRDGSIHKLIIS